VTLRWLVQPFCLETVARVSPRRLLDVGRRKRVGTAGWADQYASVRQSKRLDHTAASLPRGIENLISPEVDSGEASLLESVDERTSAVVTDAVVADGELKLGAFARSHPYRAGVAKVDRARVQPREPLETARQNSAAAVAERIVLDVKRLDRGDSVDGRERRERVPFEPVAAEAKNVQMSRPAAARKREQTGCSELTVVQVERLEASEARRRT